jgi:serine protease Do
MVEWGMALWLACSAPPPEPEPQVELDAALSLQAIPDVAERVVRSVVTVVTVGPGHKHATPEEGLGSGVVVGADGIVVTNHHVIESADQVQVSFGEGRNYTVQVVGSDPRTDIAVLRMDKPPRDLVALEFGDSDKLRLGEVVLAVGNPFGVGQTVTMGIVSAKGRGNLGLVDYEDFIQTDAAINPGNSGGALVDLRGSLVGINTALYSRSGGSNGIGFAIPSVLAREITAHILEQGRMSRGYLGLTVEDRDGGLTVEEVAPESPADRAGLRVGDLVLSFGGRTLDADQFLIAVAATGAAQPFRVEVMRGGRRLEISGTLGDLPEDQEVRPGHELARELKLEVLTDELRQSHGLPDQLIGVWIRAVASQGRFAAGGVQPKDVVLEVNQSVVTTPEELTNRFVQGHRGRVWLRIWRRGQVLVLGV